VVDLGTIQDFKTKTEDGFNESILTKGSDVVQVKDKYALWQALVGELKTKKGECQGTGMENYGSDIWMVLGQNINQMTLDQANVYIDEFRVKYPYIQEISVIDGVNLKSGDVRLSIRVLSTFGNLEGDVVIE